MKHATYSSFYFAGFIFAVILLVFYFIFSTISEAKKHSPSISYYGFPIRYLGDNFTNIYRIKLGQEGTLFYYNAYANESSPPVLFGPHYNLLGMFTKPLGLNPFESYELLRLITIVVFILVISFLVYKTIPSLEGRILGLVLFLTATPIWQPFMNGTVLEIIEPKTYSDYFNVFTKIHSMKAHHLLAQAAMMLIFYVLTIKTFSKINLIVLFLLSVALGFLHPYVAMYAGIFIVLYGLIQIIKTKKFQLHVLVSIFVVLVTLVPIVVYHGYVLDTLWKIEMDMQGTTVWVPRTYSFQTYIFALGPVFFLSLPALLFKKIRNNSLLFMLFLWGYVPLLLFFLPDFRIPMSAYRLFQSYQQIPLAILAAAVLVNVFPKRKNVSVIIAIVFCILTVLYAYLPYKKEFLDHTNSAGHFFRTQHVIAQARPIFPKLHELTPKNSVVLASELASLAIPIYTQNKVIIGHPGTNPNFNQELEIGNQILSGEYPKNQLLEILTKFSISYIVFGTETRYGKFPQFAETPYTDLPFLKKIYSTNTMDLVEVK